MLFRKKIARSCSYCAFGARMEGDAILCRKRGMKTTCDKCRKFKYDPCKRIPQKAKAMSFSQFRDDDFSLDG